MSHLMSVYSFPTNNNDNDEPNRENGPSFLARPMKHWRKQYQSNLTSIRRSRIAIPFDKPGSIIPNTSYEVQCDTCKGSLCITQSPIFMGSVCEKCNPIKTKTQLSEQMFNHTQTYLDSKCISYNKKLSSNTASNTVGFSEDGVITQPSDSLSGPQRRLTNINCKINTNDCSTTIYKPNNIQHAQQGGVSGGSHISRLKYNTLNKNGAAFLSAYGAVSANDGLYKNEPSPSYFTKNKQQSWVSPRKNGNKTSCSTDYNMCMFS